MAGRGLPPERVRAVLDYLAAGLNPVQAARAAGVSKSLAYRLDRSVSGVSRLAAKREAAACRAGGPGRGLRPERVRAVLDQLAAGCSPVQAAAAAGVSESFAYRLHHTMGGVYRPPGVTYCDRYLNREERYEIARLRECGLPVRQVAVRMGRSPSTISRELARNADPRTGQISPSGRSGWRGSGSGGPSRPGCPAGRCCGPQCRTCWTAGTDPGRPAGG